MLVIRDEQMKALARAAFVHWMEFHAREFFPERCAVLGTIELRRTIQHGNEMAQRYGFAREAERCRYIDLALLLGSHFDEDPKLNWAGAVLKDPSFKNSGTRIEMLHEAACQYLRKLEDPVYFSEEVEEPEAEEVDTVEQAFEQREEVEGQLDEEEQEDEEDDEDINEENGTGQEEPQIDEDNEETQGG